jgi:phosphoribosylformylglycinamidine cyclo-ligase|tara:strand:- start:722 stop:1756 length:1035 start_codon:yes stop_codon:yes gene_type:complete
MSEEITYSASGVDIDAADEAIRRIGPHLRSTFRPEVLSDIGGFGSVVAIPEGYIEPILVSGNDGAGTKTLVAMALNRYETIGIDVVAMCVDDIATSGAEPLFFLDQITIGSVNPDRIEELVKGFADGCRQAGCALTGGEIAEHPGLMGKNEFDLSGFAVGIAERSRLPSVAKVQNGDLVIGIASPGLRCNGYSLARKILMNGQDLEQPAFKGAEISLGEELLKPSVIYAPTLLALFSKVEVRGAAHITGGGLPGNLNRVIPRGLDVIIRRNTWRRPKIFDRIAKDGPVSINEMEKVFNLGIGMTLIVRPEDALEAIEISEAHGHEAFIIGKTVRGDGVVRMVDD